MEMDEAPFPGDVAALGVGRMAVVDIGSNSVRLVVYEGPARTPFPVFNEKATCGLAIGLAVSGRLNPEGVELALKTMTRFAKLAEVMGARRVDLLATAAVREAVDGAVFVEEVSRRFGRPVTVLSGDEEARLAGLGVISGRPDADGVMGDLGGGSLDLLMLENGAFGKTASLPLGALRLADMSGGDRGKARDLVDKAFEGVPWLKEGRKRDLYPIGGAWRALAHIAINQTGYPLHVLEGFVLPRAGAFDLAHFIKGLSRKSLDSVPWVSPRRAQTLPLAALVLERLLLLVQPRNVVFSVYGMREGRYFQSLPAEVREADPLVSACEALGRMRPRFPIRGEELWRWMQPLFPDETAPVARLRLAACLLGDLAWMEHPDHRPESAFRRVLRSPFTGVTHRERVALAYALCCRYGGDASLAAVRACDSLLDKEGAQWALAVGRALRLAFSLSGGVPALLHQTRLEMDSKRLVLATSDEDSIFLGEAVDRRLKALGKALDREPILARRGGSASL